MSLWFLAYVAGAAFLFAKLEIEIEGPNGWAERLPTWRIEGRGIIGWLFGGRPLTGYHLWAFTFVFMTFHLPFALGLPWSVGLELRLFGGYLLFWLLEDVLWFLLNPHFGWKKLTPENVWWHKRWVLGLPVDYWVAAALAVVLLTVP